jgi:hypothetical protein
VTREVDLHLMATVPRLTSPNCAEICSHGHAPSDEEKTPIGIFGRQGREKNQKLILRLSNQYLANKVKARLSGAGFILYPPSHKNIPLAAVASLQPLNYAIIVFQLGRQSEKANLWPQLM